MSKLPTIRPAIYERSWTLKEIIFAGNYILSCILVPLFLIMTMFPKKIIKTLYSTFICRNTQKTTFCNDKRKKSSINQSFK